MILMFDTITVDTVPSNPQAVAGYVAGKWPTYIPLVQKYPKAFHLSISPFASVDAECLDCEPGDATIGEVRGWVDRQLNRGIWRPCVYADLDYFVNQGLLNVLSSYGNKVRRWVADYTYNSNQAIPSWGDAIQWTDHYDGVNLDASNCLDNFFDDQKPPIPPNPYAIYLTTPTSSPYGPLVEQRIVLQYDGARKHPLKYRGYLKDVLEPRLKFLADRVAYVAEHDLDKNGQPSWDKFNRGFRFQGLIHRAQGKQLVK